ncbi:MULTISPECIES: hypothetical protein [unclassified Microcoleus]|uniref:hypothetical protein n=1 Tax=unclassified Microcoleus TaxID=2642155 RepID=UPI002FD0144B
MKKSGLKIIRRLKPRLHRQNPPTRIEGNGGHGIAVSLPQNNPFSSFGCKHHAIDFRDTALPYPDFG